MSAAPIPRYVPTTTMHGADVGLIVGLDDTEKLDLYFANFLIPVANPHVCSIPLYHTSHTVLFVFIFQIASMVELVLQPQY